jgi:putative spermidine/putrescine transport system ATP-binding protein
MALIEFERLRKAYPGSSTAAVEDLNLHIEAGEFLTLLGPSGSGKTTTLMLLAGFEQPTSGHIRLDGKPIEALPAHQRNMGVVFQSYSLFPHMTVAQNVAFPLSVRKVPTAQVATQVQEALAKVRLAHLAERKPSQLSGGQQQRVALARALVFAPRLVLMDEPLSALDKKLREEMQLEVRRLHRELGMTMVFVTHDQAEAMTLSDRVAVFNHGRIEQVAGPQQLYDAPANAFVASFVGDNNLLQAPRRGAGVMWQEQVLTGRVAGTTAPHTDATLCVRPEHLQLRANMPSLQTENRLEAQLTDLIHQGDHWRAVLQLAGGSSAPRWLAKLPSAALAQGLAPGRTVALGFQTQDAWVF